MVPYLRKHGKNTVFFPPDCDQPTYICANCLMDKSIWYKEWFSSPYYHKLQADIGGIKETNNFLERLVNRIKPTEKSRFVELFCGLGENSLSLAKMGFEVTGIDASGENIAAAQLKSQENPEFFLHDIRLPFWGNFFHYAIDLSGQFGHYRTQREFDDVMRTLSRSLYPGGLFIIDTKNVHYEESQLIAHETKKIDQTQYEIARHHNETHFYTKIRVTDPALSSAIEVTEELAKLTAGDYTDMLSFQDLQVEGIYGTREFGDYDIMTSPRMIIIARKQIK